ncbi:multi-beta-barrel domain surface protein OmpL47 [Leptospira santarosai]|uniref:Bacterial group 3 Ig-like protein n=1 Tax=Leptospira santarosai str. CBC1416 TaxID=1193059 RepID=M6VLJ9_9LEPT|nr:hypothetical protein [Leptospira santarosai]EMO57695.1 bacterial group 3 Ig-like protein [Leptospira santarosai str. CBC1416]EKR93405.1 bacterial group 3 Ig-like protein [Leptospira santarosai str. CBC379]EMF92286.1 bacterial group 3 Ig-like protein [Leptospira santarosai str. ST188]EMJ45937.1 bacterial group 3 Ig-like protein [Leptospira santarosai str. HAI1349]EMO23154.1 bacterial group 3 Ig-like protein [Leptospira santarosai str. HAI134]
MKGSSLVRLAIAFLMSVTIALVAQEDLDENSTPQADTQEQSGSSTPTKTSPSSTTTPAEDIKKADLYVNSKSAFEISAQDDSSTVDYIEYKIGEADYAKYTSPITILKEGVNRLTYRAVDKAGNKEPAKALVVVVDNTAPTVKIVPSEILYNLDGYNFGSKNVTYTISASDALSGVKEIKYSINGGDMRPYDNQPIKLEKAGVNLIKYSAVDNSGNSSSEAILVVSLDDVKPEVEIQGNTPLVIIDGKTYSRKGNSFTIKAADGQSGIKRILIKMDNAPDFVAYAEPITIDAQGEHTIEAKAIDNVGNESETKKVSFAVDVNPPTTQIRKIEVGSNGSKPAVSAEPTTTPTKPTTQPATPPPAKK